MQGFAPCVFAHAGSPFRTYFVVTATSRYYSSMKILHTYLVNPCLSIYLTAVFQSIYTYVRSNYWFCVHLQVVVWEKLLNSNFPATLQNYPDIDFFFNVCLYLRKIQRQSKRRALSFRFVWTRQFSLRPVFLLNEKLSSIIVPRMHNN